MVDMNQLGWEEQEKVEQRMSDFESIKDKIYLMANAESRVRDTGLMFPAFDLKEIVLTAYVPLILYSGKHVVVHIGRDTPKSLWGNSISNKDIYDLALKNTERDKKPMNIFSKTSLYMCVTTEDLTYGAVLAFVPGVLEDIASQYEDNLYVCFTSTHEMMVHPASDCITVKDLYETLNSTVDECTEDHEILSRNVYFYDADRKTFTIAKKEEEE